MIMSLIKLKKGAEEIGNKINLLKKEGKLLTINLNTHTHTHTHTHTNTHTHTLIW